VVLSAGVFVCHHPAASPTYHTPFLRSFHFSIVPSTEYRTDRTGVHMNAVTWLRGAWGILALIGVLELVSGPREGATALTPAAL